MKLINFLFANVLMISGVFAILLFTLMVVSDIGKPSFYSCGDIYTWGDAAKVFVVLTVPFCLGYLARSPNDKTVFDD